MPSNDKVEQAVQKTENQVEKTDSTTQYIEEDISK